MFENYKVFETDFAGRPLKIETGKIAQLANGACFVRYGDTVVNVAAHRVGQAPGRHRLSSRCRWTLRKSCMRWARFPAPSCDGRAARARRRF